MGITLQLSGSLAYATVLPGSPRARRRQAHTTSEPSKPQLGRLAKEEVLLAAGRPQPDSVHPRPTRPGPLCLLLKQPASLEVCFLASSDPREKFKETQLRHSWTTSALNQVTKMPFLLPSSLYYLPNGPLQSLTKGLSPDVCQSFPEISQALLRLSFYAQRLIKIICQSTPPFSRNSPLN